MPWLTPTSEGWLISIRLVPRAARNEIQGRLGDSLKIRLQAPPVEGQANRALMKYLAAWLDISPAQIRLTAGSTTRHKKILVRGLDEATLRQRLRAAG